MAAAAMAAPLCIVAAASAYRGQAAGPSAVVRSLGRVVVDGLRVPVDVGALVEAGLGPVVDVEEAGALKAA
jgi:hypothetical protein